VARDGCGAGSASQHCLYSGGQNMSVLDLLTGKTWKQQYFRTPCGTGPLAANGMLFSFGACCQCVYPLAAPLCLAPAGLDWMPPEADHDMAARLIPGPASGNPLSDDSREEWTHYRGKAGHTGETAVSPGMPLAVGWARNLGGRLTPPSAGGGSVYVASREGAVWALDQKTGEIRWRFACGAGVRVTPAFGRGRVVFGSDDGWIYCLDAASGQPAWRFRAAPEDLYINAGGQLSSIWPSAAGVLVDGEVVYGAAGYLPFDGAYLYALNLKTGKPVWAKRIGDPAAEQGAPEGVMALAGETLIVPSFVRPHNRPVWNKGGNQAYRKSDGAKLDWYPDGVRGPYPPPLGSEAVADGDVFFYGGPGHGEERSAPANFSLMEMTTGMGCGNNNAAKTGIPPVIITPPNVAPVLGKSLILGDGVGYDRARFCAATRDQPGKFRDTALWSTALWPQKRSKTNGLALAGRVAIASSPAEVVAWEARTDGRELARVRVPGGVHPNSLAVAGGRIFVVTDGGSVVCLAGN
jgi:outer membrane protein assembly factor BamB